MVVLERVLALGGRESRGPKLGVHWVEGSEIKLTFLLIFIDFNYLPTEQKGKSFAFRSSLSWLP